MDYSDKRTSLLIVAMKGFIVQADWMFDCLPIILIELKTNGKVRWTKKRERKIEKIRKNLG
jgi:hypothetical protein